MEQLQEAEDAIAAGDRQAAQLHLAKVLKQDPQNVAAWTMLSQVAATPEQSRLFLEKAARIDPLNEAVQAALAAQDDGAEEEQPAFNVEEEPAEDEAHEPPGMPISDDPFDFEAQAEGDSLPQWLAGDEQFLAVEIAIGGTVGGEPDQSVNSVADIEIPDWLQTEPEISWLEQSRPDPALESAGDGQPAGDKAFVSVDGSGQKTKKRKKRKGKQPTRLEAILEWAIAVFAILLFLLLILFLFG